MFLVLHEFVESFELRPFGMFHGLELVISVCFTLLGFVQFIEGPLIT